MIKILLPLLVALLLTSSPLAAAPPTLQCGMIPVLSQALLRAHVGDRSMNSELYNNAAEQMIKRLDPAKHLLLQSDVDAIRPKVVKFFENLRNPDCSEIEAAKNTLVSRAKEQLAFAKETLNPKYKLDESVEYLLDSEKRTFPKSAEEAKARQLVQIHFQISNYLLTGMKLPAARKQLIHRYELILKRMQELKTSDVYDHIVNSFAAALDPHSNYLSPEATEDFRINMNLSLEGIGASLSNDDGFTVIQELIPGGAAAKSNMLEPKDKIIAVAQDGKPAENVIDMDLRDVVRKIRGKSGSKVHLTILRDKPQVTRFTVTLVRAKVKLEDDAAKVEYYDRKIDGKKFKLARIELPGFYGGACEEQNSAECISCYKDMARLISEVNDKKVDGLVLDLSQNGGGLLDEAVKIAGLFIGRGNIVATKGSEPKPDLLDDRDPRVQYTGPLVILTSRLSASASEIVAGALQDYRRAVVVGGDHTYGKGTVQAVLPLQNGYGILKVTTGLFYIPGGNSTQWKGVNTDISFPSPYSVDDIGERYLDHSLKPDGIPAFLSPEAYESSQWAPVNRAEVEKLKLASAARVAKSKDFAEILKEIQENEERKGVIKLADLRKKDTEQKRKDRKKAPKQLAKERAQPQIQEALNILADFVHMRAQGSGKLMSKEVQAKQAKK